MNIRKAHNGDIPGLIALLLQVGQVHHELRPDIFRPATQKYDEAALSAILADEGRPVFVAMDGAFVAGYCFCISREYKDSGVSTNRRELYIDDLCVDENRRGQGIASALYRHVRDYAKNSGCSFITLKVWCGNEKAMHFYEKMGMRPRNITMEASLEESYAD
jgi:ribosomal protein S18 acetylase RimI-like enzyme